MKLQLFVFAAVLSLAAQSSIVPVYPVNGETVNVQTKEELAVSRHRGYKDRLAEVRANKDSFGKDKNKKWRIAPPVELKWKTTEKEHGPWKIMISKSPDFKNPVVYCERHAGKEKTASGDIRTFKAERHNLEVGRTYWWKVVSGTKKKAKESKPATFKTADTPPRWIAIEGRVANIRDIGGWKTEDGKRVRQGLVFRGQGLNDNSANGAVKGRNRLMVEDRDYLVGTLGIKTDLDLRSGRETADMTTSPLGKEVKFVHHSSEHYQRIFNKAGKKTMAKNFRVFTDEKNYPVYFHCIAGADRTGALAYTLLGVLGVSQSDASIDWEYTFYPWMPELQKGFSKKYWRREQHLENGFKKYGNENSSFKERAELYLLDCGITKQEIEKFRSIMLEDAKEAK